MIHITDISLDNDGDISISGGDLDIIADKECFLQTLKSGLNMPPLSLPHAPWEGILIPKEIPTDGDGVALVQRRYEDYLLSDERIQPDSVEVDLDSSSADPVFQAKFLTVDGDNYEVSL